LPDLVGSDRPHVYANKRKWVARPPPPPGDSLVTLGRSEAQAADMQERKARLAQWLSSQVGGNLLIIMVFKAVKGY